MLYIHEKSINSVSNKNTVPAVVPRHKMNSFSYGHYMIKEGDDSF